MTEDEFVGVYNAARQGLVLESDEPNDDATRNRGHEARVYALEQIRSNDTQEQKRLFLHWTAHGWPEP
jgi:hypothetical protein